MTNLESLLLGLIQGLSEFLPISSSAHLVVLPWLVGFDDPGLTFDVVLHLGTLLALVGYFWRDWTSLLVDSFIYLLNRLKGVPGNQSAETERSAYLLCILCVSTVPGALAGYLLETLAEGLFRHPLVVAGNLFFFGLLLWIADSSYRGAKELGQIRLTHGLLVGLSQALALIPGVSRSGVTMTTGLFLGMSRVASARFSFLMAFPITLGAFIYKIPDLLKGGFGVEHVIGLTASSIMGFVAIGVLMRLVQNHSYLPFVFYRFGLAALILVVYWGG